MKILHISKYDCRGGAAIAARNSVLAQRDHGHDARMLVGRKFTDQDYIEGPNWWGDKIALARFAIERLPMAVTATDRTETQSIGLTGIRASSIRKNFTPDIIVLHNIDGLIRIEDIPFLPAPVIWRMHDMWALLGTSHYDGRNWARGAQRLSWVSERLNSWTSERKRRAIFACDSITLVPPSHWLANEAVSALPGLASRITVIPNGIDTRQFFPEDQAESRALLKINSDDFVVLFGAASGIADLRKGFDLLVEALQAISNDSVRRRLRLVTFGGMAGNTCVAGIPCLDLGRISDRSFLRRTYSAADMTVVPSREENLSLTVLEALACGSPVASFNIGGMPDMIRDGENGWLIQPFNTDALAEVIVRTAQEQAGLARYRSAARETVEKSFTQSIEAHKMQNLFDSIINGQ